MEGVFFILGLVMAAVILLFFLMDRRWRRVVEQFKAAPSLHLHPEA